MSQIAAAGIVPGGVEIAHDRCADGAAPALITLEQMKLVHDLLMNQLRMAGKYQKHEFEIGCLVPVTVEGFYLVCSSNSQSFAMQVYRARSTILLHLTQTLLEGGNIEEHNERSNEVTLMVCATWNPDSMQHDALNIHIDNIVEAAVIGPRSDGCRALFLGRREINADKFTDDKCIKDVGHCLPATQAVFNSFAKLKWPKPQLLKCIQWDGGFLLGMKSRKHFDWEPISMGRSLSVLIVALRENETAVLNFCDRTWLYLPQHLLLDEAVVTEIRDMLLMEH
jgi:hypothetical protein